jgi:hypothetical protein
VFNGQTLPDNGLTVATSRPLYVQGHYNANSAHLGTTNTTLTKPASFVSDSINILSQSWNDTNSASGISSRPASATTVNAAFLSGIVESKDSNRTKKYSGGVENYPRLLEHWQAGGKKTLTYNGSMVVLFSSQYATNGWQYGGDFYTAPYRNWSFDLNFLDPGKLPPGTPQLSTMIRGRWSAISAGYTNSFSY